MDQTTDGFRLGYIAIPGGSEEIMLDLGMRQSIKVAEIVSLPRTDVEWFLCG
jgi:hypothetical protein